MLKYILFYYVLHFFIPKLCHDWRWGKSMMRDQAPQLESPHTATKRSQVLQTKVCYEDFRQIYLLLNNKDVRKVKSSISGACISEDLAKPQGSHIVDKKDRRLCWCPCCALNEWRIITLTHDNAQSAFSHVEVFRPREGSALCLEPTPQRWLHCEETAVLTWKMDQQTKDSNAGWWDVLSEELWTVDFWSQGLRKGGLETSWSSQWLGLCAFTAKGPGSPRSGVYDLHSKRKKKRKPGKTMA